MTITSRAEPKSELDPQFSSPGAQPSSWADAREALDKAEVYWLTTVRPDGRPHVTPLVAVWVDEALHFCTGPTERKAKNLADNKQVVVTTGSNVLDGLDVVLEGDAILVRDEAMLRRIADRYNSKYESPFHFTVRDGGFYGEGPDPGAGDTLVFRVRARKIFAFRKGETFSQTRWRF